MKTICIVSLLGSLSLIGCGIPENVPMSRVTSLEQPASTSASRNEDGCRFHKRYGDAPSVETFRAFILPPWVRFRVPDGTFRYTFEGRNPKGSCEVEIKARHSDACGSELFDAKYRDSTGPVWSDIEGLPHVAVPHVVRSGMTIRSIPGTGGLLSYDNEIKFFGESVDTLVSYEHFRPVFPLSFEKYTCSDLKLVKKEPFSTDPYDSLDRPPL